MRRDGSRTSYSVPSKATSSPGDYVNEHSRFLSCEHTPHFVTGRASVVRSGARYRTRTLGAKVAQRPAFPQNGVRLCKPRVHHHRSIGLTVSVPIPFAAISVRVGS